MSLPTFAYASAQDLDILCENAAHTYVPVLVTGGNDTRCTVAFATIKGGAVEVETIRPSSLIDAQEYRLSHASERVEHMFHQVEWEELYPDRPWEEWKVKVRFSPIDEARMERGGSFFS